MVDYLHEQALMVLQAMWGVRIVSMLIPWRPLVCKLFGRLYTAVVHGVIWLNHIVCV